jgi:hypothetical protein
MYLSQGVSFVFFLLLISNYGDCREIQRNAKKRKGAYMESFTTAEFTQWAKNKKLTFLTQVAWPDATKLLPEDEVATKLSADTLGHVNLFTSPKKELFLTVCLIPASNQVNAMILVFKQLTSLK